MVSHSRPSGRIVNTMPKQMPSSVPVDSWPLTASAMRCAHQRGMYAAAAR